MNKMEDSFFSPELELRLKTFGWKQCHSMPTDKVNKVGKLKIRSPGEKEYVEYLVSLKRNILFSKVDYGIQLSQIVKEDGTEEYNQLMIKNSFVKPIVQEDEIDLECEINPE